MSTLKVTNIQHPSAASPSIELSADGSIVLPLSGIGDLADVDEGSGAVDGDVLTYDGSGDVWVPQGLVLPAGIGSNVVQSVLTARFTTTSGTFTTVTGLSATITPSSATSKVLVIVQISYGLSASSLDSAPIFRISGGNATTYVGDASGSRTRAVFGGLVLGGSTLRPHVMSGNLVYLDSPGAAVATTYELEVLSGTGTATINGLTGDANVDAASRVAGASSITCIEVAV